MMSNWWKRFFGLEEDPEEDPSPSTRHINNEKVTSSDHEAGLGQKVGRFEDPFRNVEVKVLHQYPNYRESMTSKYGPPPSRLSPKTDRASSGDESGTTNRLAPAYQRKVNQKASPSSEPIKKEETAPKPIKRSKFVATTVPSPVYGYRERPAYLSNDNQKFEAQKSDNQMDDLHNHQTRSKQAQIIEPSKYETASHEVRQLEKHEEQSLTSRQELDQTPPLNNQKERSEPTHGNQENRLNSVNVSSTQSDGASRKRKQRLRQVERTQSEIPYNVLMYQSDRLVSHSNKNKQGNTLSMSLLNDSDLSSKEDDHQWIEEKKRLLGDSLKNFNLKADVLDYIQGPTVTRFEIRLHPGVKVNKIISLTEDLKLTLSAKQIRIAPISGKNTVGIEIPNPSRKPVHLKALLQSKAYQSAASPLTAVLGQDISGNHVVTDLAKMPHGLIAGATGSGKSVCIHSLILSLIYKATPDELRFILIDPKVVELATYRALPHLAAPVITQTREAALALKWAVDEMENRYQLFAETGVRDLSRYNDMVQTGKIKGSTLPYIVIVIDELADLMMTSPQEVEAAICRIAQKARAAGIHMLLATQRPSVDVITGLIKSNIPTRIAFSVSSQVDSRTILDMSGAERLLGQGDLLFSENGSRSLLRLQGTFVTDEEIERITETFHDQESPGYLFDASDLQDKPVLDQEEDDLFEEAGQFVINQGQASVSSLQRRFRIGYNRAARLVDQLESASVITESNGSKPRQILMDKQTFEHEILSLEKIEE